MTSLKKPTILPPVNADGTALTIAKPGEFSLDKFRATHPPTIAGVATLQRVLPHFKIARAKDFVRLHPDEENYWSPVYCFVSVPIKGQGETLHLIAEDLVLRYLSGGGIEKYRLALASKPHDVFFLAHVPDLTNNPDNIWNSTNLDGCQQAKRTWTKLTSRRGEGVEGYDINYAQDPDAFPEPNWPQQSLGNLIEVTFSGLMIDHDDHPGLLRLLGKRQLLT